MKKIGILGGMGPQASAHFYDLIIEKVIEKKPDARNQDYPYMVITNIPVPDLITSKKDQEITIEMVHQEALNLERTGVNFLMMSCNTMHLFQDEIVQGISIPFISMIDSVVERVKADNIRTVGLLGSSTTLQSGLYTNALRQSGIKAILPPSHEYECISQVILKYISGSIDERDLAYIDKVCRELFSRGVEAIILGCTELPLIVRDMPNKYKFYKSDEILADNILSLI